MTTTKTSPFEILVGALEYYRAFPGDTRLLDDYDGHYALCSMGCIGRAAGLSDDELRRADDAGCSYEEIFHDENGIDTAVRLLAKEMAGRSEGEYDVGDCVTISEHYDIITGVNDDFKPERIYNSQGKKLIPNEHVIACFEAAISEAGKL